MSWLAFFVGWTVIHGSVWDDIVSAVVTAWFISVAASSLAFFLWTLRRGGQQTKG
jgi:hypothetical protein